ncbi:UDP-N-acetylmuramoyl-tripeptide--D-alanyl-D-alanine ligase [Pokkaliibacter sp. CJK22405]|uniref:UDP-N-acetylmuramoyl-tripeptide--D-alanyl-D- alanine ligase n=1 Tax=Pokkaliibacter sp. CJK22405 TaxID=3384615 RepID=UPI003984C827
MIGQWTLADVANAIGAELPSSAAFLPCEGVYTDSRAAAEGRVFLALVGERFDAHDFIDQAIEQGAIAVIVSRPVDVSVPVLQVENTLIALGAVGKANRSRFTGKVVAVTGSSGKTTVKEMAAAILATQGKTLYTQGNLNNEIGAPQTLMRLDETHHFGVIELGASGGGEIARTVAMTKPHVSILNNAAGAHLEGFGSLMGVVKAKGEIIDGVLPGGKAVLNADDPHVDIWVERAAENGKGVILFGESERADVRFSEAEVDALGLWRAQMILPDGEKLCFKLSIPGRHNLANATAAAAACWQLGVPAKAIAQGLSEVKAVKGRCFPIQSPAGLRIIDDSYNANPSSMTAAVLMLSAMPGPHVLALGSMAELGSGTVSGHQQVGEAAAKADIDWLFCCGPHGLHYVEGFIAAGGDAERALYFPQKADLVVALQQKVENTMVVLCKGSRSAGMEDVVNALAGGVN